MSIEVFAYVNTSDWNEFLAIQGDLNLRITKTVEQAGTGFALPSRTSYLPGDNGHDRDKQEAAEKKVREWASAHQLPFPEFDPAYRKQVTNTLDYPPVGSPDADSAQ